MPKSKEYISSDNSDSEQEVKQKKKSKREAEEKEEKPPKKAKKEQKQEEEESTWDLGNNRQVSVRDFKGKLLVDIREMYYDKDANLKPGKKGISLNMAQWRKLMSFIEEVDAAVKSKS